jgi:predicted ester cyclase
MSLEANKLLVRRFYEDAFNTGNVELIESLVSPDYVEVHDGKRHLVGMEGAKAHAVGVRQTYPDLHILIEQQIAEGEWVVSCIKATGTHKGSWLGIKPTGKSVTFTGVNVDRVVDGKIVEHGGAANMLGPLLEIGAIKVVGNTD